MRYVLLLLILLITAAPAAAQDADRYANLPQSVTLQGFPRVGFPSALIEVTIYGGFDSTDSAAFWAENGTRLIERAQAGEIRIVFVPLAGRGSLPGGRAAARAAICVADQGAFWRYHDLLFAWQAEFGAQAYQDQRLLDGALALGIERGRFTSCVSSTGPDTILESATGSASSSSVSALPHVMINSAPTLTDAASLEFVIDLEVQRASEQMDLQLTPQPETTDEAGDVITYAPLSGESVPPPIEITLPDGWAFAYDALVLQDIDALRPVPFALYQGPVTGGTGTIVLLWGFPNLVIANPFAGGGIQPDVWADGTRLLRLAIVEQGCNVGTDLRRIYRVGTVEAVGTQFAAVDCPELADTRGWFAGVRQFNANYIFYAFAEPIGAMNTAEAELQAILNTVVFLPPPTPAPAGE